MPTIKVSSMLCVVRLTYFRDMLSAVDGWHQCYEGVLERGQQLEADPDRSRKEVAAFLAVLAEMEGFGNKLMLAQPDDDESWISFGRRDTIERVRGELRQWIAKANRWKRTAKRKRPPGHLN